MPELPEVETIRRGLKDKIVGHIITSIEQLDPRIMNVDETVLKTCAYGESIIGARRRGKALILDLSSMYSLVVHLKMTGQTVYRGEQNFAAGHPNDSLIGDLPDRTTRVIFNFSNGSRLFYNDQRRFGWIKFLPSHEVEQIDFMKKLGPEPLEDSFTLDIFTKQLSRKNSSTIKSVLLDQSTVAGIGNIYADEALFLAKIHPQSQASQIPRVAIARLFHAIKKVLLLGIEKGGSTDKNYVNAEGRKGSYLDFANVFRKEGTSCPVCGEEIIKIRVAGRGTHVCHSCQKLYSGRAK